MSPDPVVVALVLSIGPSAIGGFIRPPSALHITNSHAGGNLAIWLDDYVRRAGQWQVAGFVQTPVMRESTSNGGPGPWQAATRTITRPAAFASGSP
jgi:hypothetical protein